MAEMRAKMQVLSVMKDVSRPDGQGNETLTMCAVSKSGGYPADGSDEDN